MYIVGIVYFYHNKDQI